MDQKYSMLILRLGLGIVFLYFGLYEKLLHPEMSFGYLHAAQQTIPLLSTETWFIYVLGALEILVALGLLLGTYTRIVASIAALMLLKTIITLGIFVVPRDVGLLAAALALAIHEEKERTWTKSSGH